MINRDEKLEFIFSVIEKNSSHSENMLLRYKNDVILHSNIELFENEYMLASIVAYRKEWVLVHLTSSADYSYQSAIFVQWNDLKDNKINQIYKKFVRYEKLKQKNLLK